MASADLDHIRALLIAQTAEPEPKRGLLSVFGRRNPRSAPLALDAPLRRPPPAPSSWEYGDQELLLERICVPTVAAPPPQVIPETHSPLPPPDPRSAFGRRSDQDDLELLLDHHEVEEPSAVPFFPEDLAETDAEIERLFSEPQPMRPWIKALRSSSKPASPVEAAPVADRGPPRKRKRTVAPPPPARCAKAEALSRDLLEALEVALTREHHQLDDRLSALAA